MLALNTKIKKKITKNYKTLQLQQDPHTTKTKKTHSLTHTGLSKLYPKAKENIREQAIQLQLQLNPNTILWTCEKQIEKKFTQ